MKITINGNELELKNKFRSYIIYETITSKMFNPQTVSDMITYMFAVILANYPDIELKFDDFLDWLDSNPDQFAKFNQWVVDSSKSLQQGEQAEKKGMAK